MNKKRIYLDNNATTSIDPRVLEVVFEQLKADPSNPSSVHYFGQKAKAKLLDATQNLSDFFCVKPQEIIFTSGATESLNMVIKGLFDPSVKGHIITSSVEHAVVFQLMKWVEKNGWEVTLLDPEKGTSAISVAQVLSAIRPHTRCICLMWVNNETGEKTDIEAISSLAEQNGIALVVDGVALLGKESFRIPKGVSAICFSGHKIHAPQGIGLAIIRQKLKINPLLLGGSQQYAKRAGTENMAAILGMAKAIMLLKEEQSAIEKRMHTLRDRFETGLQQSLPNLLIHGRTQRVCNTSNIAFLDVDGESLLFNLDQEGIAASHGSACMSGTLEPSRILLNMGNSKDVVRSSLRFSISKFTTEEEIESAIQTITSLVRKLR